MDPDLVQLLLQGNPAAATPQYTDPLQSQSIGSLLGGPTIGPGDMASAQPNPGVPTAGDPMGSGAGGVGGGGMNKNTLAASLKGVQALKPPEPQKITSPHLLAKPAIQGNNLMQLLQAMNVPGAEVQQQYKLPSTLSSALGIH